MHRIVKREKAGDGGLLIYNSSGWWQTQISEQTSVRRYPQSVPPLRVAVVLTETLLRAAVHLGLPVEREQGPRVWCTTEEAEPELHTRWQESEDGRQTRHFLLRTVAVCGDP